MTRALPSWPRKMKLDFACAYCDESRNTFLRRVAQGLYPAGRPLGGNRYWFREDLDDALDKLKRNGEPSSPFIGALDGLDQGAPRS